ncbi:pre-mRNA-splicing factor SPF27 [Thraustotheca clavata]|uniref:Pre-mRNA-splicing factor SPF27 n=1 Tax=Thraustotheca clavata TaxID=74557 RepID=A0A1W0AA27_9STRA|nr:pre-mRNA-splicing factor SPF27 [Thraustotheca clavata]
MASTCPLLNETRHLIDCLGYIDTNEDAEMNKLVNLQIQQQMAQMPAPDMDQYLAFLPPPPLGLEAKEMKRVAAGVALDAINVNKYRVAPPTTGLLKKTQDPQAQVEAWSMATNNAKVAIEYQTSRILNLEMLNKYGANRWKLHVGVMNGIHDKFAMELDQSKQECDAVNVKRKQEQLLNADKLRGLQRRRDELVRKTQHIESACEVLEREVKRLKTENQP